MPSNQHDVFVNSEGDRWFDRNRRALEAADLGGDLPLRLLETYGVRPRSVVEIGASNGFRVEEIRRRYGSRAVAVEPSALAVEDGRTKYPEVEFVQADASHIPIDDSFDLVIVHFVFHWIDRNYLFQTFAEVDRLLSDGGLLVIGDFLPSGPRKVPYHHLPEQAVFTFKQDYALPFLASGLYSLVAMLSADHATKRLSPDVADHDRVGVWLLRKSVSGLYL